MARFTKADIDFHSTTISGHNPVPAVNVKVRGGGYIGNVPLPLEVGGYAEAGQPIRPVFTHPLFTHEWLEEHTTEDEQQAAWESAIESGWDGIKSDAEEIFGPGTKVYSEGRSGGWAYVDGFTRDDVEGWDAVAVARWGKFSKYAQAYAADVPRQIVDWLYANIFEPWLAEQRTEAENALGDIAARERVAIYAGAK